MKEEVKSEILRQMLPYLNNEQLSALGCAIDSALKNAEITVAMAKTQEDDHSMESFITAKRIEGCSEKTLRYYRDIIVAMVAAINKQPRQITTDDLRLYLTSYQTERRSSKVRLFSINFLRIFNSVPSSDNAPFANRNPATPFCDSLETICKIQP